MQHEQAQAARAVARGARRHVAAAALASVDDGSPLRGRTLVQELAYGTLRHWGTLDGDRRAARDAAARRRRGCARCSPSRSTSSTTRVRRPSPSSTARSTRPACSRIRGAGGLGQRAAAPLPARARRRSTRRCATIPSRAGRTRAGGSSACDATSPTTGSSPRRRQRAAAAHAARQRARHARATRCSRRFATAGIDARAAGDVGVIVDPPRPVTELPGYDEGAFAVQDLGAQLAAPLLDLRDGMRVLDACAAPGGKTTHILERADVDVDGARQRRRAACAASARTSRGCGTRRRACASSPATRASRAPGGTAGRSTGSSPTCRARASGVVRRHPDGKWLRRASDVAAFARAAGPHPRRAVAAARAGRQAALRDLLGVRRRRTRRASPHSRARTPDALRETLTLPGRCAPRGRTTLAFAPRREPQSGRVLLRAASQGLTRRAARGAAPGRLAVAGPPPRVPAACRRPPRATSDVARARGRRARVLALAAIAARCSRRGAPPTSSPVSAAELRVEEGEVLLNAEFDVRAHADARGGAAEGHPALFHRRVRAHAAALVLGRREGRCSGRRPTASRTTR